MNTAQVATAALVGFGLLIAHNVADHWVQTSWQATNKGSRDSVGRAACLSHVISYTVVAVATLSVLTLIFHLPLTWYGVLAGQAISAGTHYWADRRFTLENLARKLGKEGFYKLGQPRDVTDNPSLGTGAYALDQSWHWFWIFVTTVVTVVVP